MTVMRTGCHVTVTSSSMSSRHQLLLIDWTAKRRGNKVPALSFDFARQLTRSAHGPALAAPILRPAALRMREHLHAGWLVLVAQRKTSRAWASGTAVKSSSWTKEQTTGHRDGVPSSTFQCGAAVPPRGLGADDRETICSILESSTCWSLTINRRKDSGKPCEGRVVEQRCDTSDVWSSRVLVTVSSACGLCWLRGPWSQRMRLSCRDHFCRIAMTRSLAWQLYKNMQ